MGPARRLDLVVDDAVVKSIVDHVLEETLWTQGTPHEPLGPFAAIDRSQKKFSPAMKAALADAAIESAVASAVRAIFDFSSDLEEAIYAEEDGIEVPPPTWFERMKSVANGDPGIELSLDDVDPVSRGYAEAVLFFGGADGDEDEWESISVFDFAPGVLHRIVRDCYRFLTEALGLHPRGWRGLRELDPEEFGHTFLLARQESGVSFTDRDIDQGIAQKLDEIAEVFGPAYFEVGDDGKVHLTGTGAD
jgi:hypothetical protein